MAISIGLFNWQIMMRQFTRRRQLLSCKGGEVSGMGKGRTSISEATFPAINAAPNNASRFDGLGYWVDYSSPRHAFGI